jgi:hypothetical protein
MSAPSNKVLLASLWERTSAKGNTYLSGFLGKACVVGFRGEPRPDGTPTWNIFLSPGKEQEEAAGTRAQQARRQPSDSSSAPMPGRVQRHPRPDNTKASGADPFFDDDISDIGGGR